MTDEIEKSGRVVLEGIFFDFDKSTLKPESTPALEVIAEYLNANPDKSFFVVGHTDSKGTLDYNRKLSADRAEAVTRELTGAHGAKADQLTPFGVGPEAPRARNATEDGRAQNRRVELVARE
ncbi:MAG: OmpA family protein [Pikeienuella sp.]